MTSTLSSRWNWGNLQPNSSAFSQVASVNGKFFHRTKNWVVAVLSRLTSLLSIFFYGCSRGFSERVGRSECTTWFPTCFFNWDTWNIGCTTIAAGNCSL
jgi:hypothetical protein